MTNWQTKEQVQAAAKGTLLEALECSRDHHKQGAECSYEEAVTAIGDEYQLEGTWCALCLYMVDDCKKCPFKDDQCKRTGSTFDKLADLKYKFCNDRSRANFDAFQAAERKMVAKLDELIAEEKGKTQKPKLRHGDEILHNGELNYCLYQKDANKVDGKNPLIAVTSTGMSNGNIENYREHDSIRTGNNIFDDLKALQEDVRVFEVKDVHGDKLTVMENLNEMRFVTKVTSGCDQCCLSFKLSDIPDLILKLRQMEATLKRKKINTGDKK